uniref:Uncharacterized protein n=1 Tax=Arundo donax TaxID=35708 RepID=A0A0A9F431_ARUDO
MSSFHFKILLAPGGRYRKVSPTNIEYTVVSCSFDNISILMHQCMAPVFHLTDKRGLKIKQPFYVSLAKLFR